MIINLLSSPRNVSTALMYSFFHRGDMRVYDEPFYAYYLLQSGVNHPGKAEIIKSLPKTTDGVLDLIAEFGDKPHVFVKNMSHHLVNTSLDFLGDFLNIFLIRSPYQLIASFAQVIPEPTMRDVGIKQQYEQFEKVRSNSDKWLVIDSGDLLKNPEQYLTKVCKELGLEFHNAMIKWPAGAIESDGVWAKYWYANVHKSTGFAKQSTSSRSLPPNCESLFEESLPYYEKISKYSLKV